MRLLWMVTLGAQLGLGGTPDSSCAQGGWGELELEPGALTWIVDGRWFYTLWDASRRWEASGGAVWETAQGEEWRLALEGCGYSVPWPDKGRISRLPVQVHAAECSTWVPGECSCATPPDSGPGR